MDRILEHVRARREEIISLIREMVECESPSDSAASVDRFVDLLSSRLAGEARIRTVKGGAFGRHLLAEFHLPGPRRGKDGQILGLGHSDTVWPLGTLNTMPWRRDKKRLWGPGVLDMKAGLAFFIFATRALRQLDIPVSRRVVLQVNSDEEVGSHSSRPLTERNARQSLAVLVLEPGTGLAGKLKTARKGVGGYLVRVTGVASHAGVDFAAGASAIVELAHQVGRIAGFTQLDRGVTVNPGVIRGGTRSNVIAAEAEMEVDFRIPRIRDFHALERKFRRLTPVDRRCRISIEGGLNRPPMERNKGVAALYRLASQLGGQIGVQIEESSTGGGSDGNFTAGLGVPTLDGLGAVGDGAHANHESILIERIVDRTALLAHLVASI
jgi:glutamate carboxypeptidase